MPKQRRTARIDRERIVRTLTFWFRPAFVLRAVNRFQKIAAFDRAVALASSALTASVAVLILAAAVLPDLSGSDLADRIITRYDLTGGGADAVRDVFAVPDGATGSIGVIGAVFLMVAALSFTRAVQRLFEQAWELKPLSVRNTLNDLRWLGVFALYIAATGWIHAELGVGRLELLATLVALPLGFLFLWWSARMARPSAVRRYRGRPHIGVHRRRDGVRAASVQQLRDPLRRDRRGLRDDLGPVLRDGGRRRLGGRRARGGGRAAAHRPRRTAGGRPGPSRVGQRHRRGALEVGRRARGARATP
jgi:hypothetical protein